MQTVKELVTPAMAQEWLRNCNPEGNNRKFRPAWAKELASYILNGTFHLTHQGIAFSTDNMLADGQHRLAAIVDSGKSVELYVTRGLPLQSRSYIDTNRSRTVSDALRIDGVDANAAMVATANLMHFAGAGFSKAVPFGRDLLMAYYQRHHQAIAFSMQTRHKATCNANVRAPIARAYYTADRERLKEFIDVLNTGMPIIPDDDSAAILLRNYMINKASVGVRLGSNGKERSDLYYRASTALFHFLNRNKVGQLRPSEREFFPVYDDALRQE